MTLKNKIFFYTIIFSFLMQTQTVYTMENQQGQQTSKMSKYNPLSWIYGFFSVVHYNFGWVTAATADEKITASFERLKRFNESMFADILEGNHSFAAQIIRDGFTVNEILDNTNVSVNDFRKIVLLKIDSLNNEGKITKSQLETAIDKFKKSSLQRLSETRKTITDLDQRFLIAEQFTQANLEKNNTTLLCIKEKFKDEIRAVASLRIRNHDELQTQVLNIKLEQQKHHEITTNALQAVQHDIGKCNESYERNLENNKQEKVSVKSLFEEIKKRDIRLQKLLNGLSCKQSSKQSNKFCVPETKSVPKKTNKPSFASSLNLGSIKIGEGFGC